jgi:hypothetical protein
VRAPEISRGSEDGVRLERLGDRRGLDAQC